MPNTWEKIQNKNSPPSISLDGGDANNNVFRLEKVSIEKCEDAISKVTEADGGC